MNVGILGVGAYLPEEVRPNSWWSEEVTQQWPERLRKLLARQSESTSLGVKLTVEAFREHEHDPFTGAKERRVAPASLSTSDMETRAAEIALKRAETRPGEIDLLLVHSMVPDFQTTNTATFIHQKLGLPSHCQALNVSAVCNSFIAQLTMAEALIGRGRAKRALLVQSSTVSRIHDMNDPFTAWCGDGATAVVVGEVSPSRGFLSVSHRTQSENAMGIVTGGAEQPWYEGPSRTYIADSAAARRAVFEIPDASVEVIQEALKSANLEAAQVDFYACHQTNSSLRRVTQQLNGLSNAKFIDTFATAGSLSSANLPLQLERAQQSGMLKNDAAVLLFAMGSGTTISAATLRWGR